MDPFTSSDNYVTTLTEEPLAGWKVKRRRRPARLIKAVGFAVAGALAAFVVWKSVDYAVRESHLAGCKERLKQLGVAFHYHVEAQGHLPAPIIAAADGKPLLSWRVAILPHLGYQLLYERFHLDEPWDSPHNRALVKEMPREFACPGLAAPTSGLTGYVVFVGPRSDMASVNTPFEPARGVDLREVTDGTSNTILVFETDTSVCWTKPEDLEWDPGKQLPRISSSHSGGTHALFIDGSTRFLKPTIEQRIFRAILTINGGEVVSSS
jgi:hypothetical protein